MTLYMLFWSIVMIGLLGIGRLRYWQQWLMAGVGTVAILLISQTLFAQLSLSVGVDPNYGIIAPSIYFNKGIMGWMSLLIMPCGWLAPIISLNAARRSHTSSVANLQNQF